MLVVGFIVIETKHTLHNELLRRALRHARHVNTAQNCRLKKKGDESGSVKKFKARLVLSQHDKYENNGIIFYFILDITNMKSVLCFSIQWRWANFLYNMKTININAAFIRNRKAQ